MATRGSDPDREGGDRAAEGDPVNKLTCAICLEKFRRPKMLVCFHTFCQSCLQGVAGTSPTLACPSCRTPILLPPGGVSALQTNFYIEGNLDSSETSPQRRLCDLCTEDREASHTCIQCQKKFCLHCRKCHDGLSVTRGHNMVSLTQEDNDSCQKGGAPSHRSDDKTEPEMCPKHPDQRLLLHCKKCHADICMQCKLTQHEGHPTDDLSDTRAKARTRLQDMLGSVTRHRQQVGQLILALTHRRASLHQHQQETQRDFQGRADTLYQWVNQSLEDAVRSVQSTAEELEKPLQNRVEQLQNRDLALQAQQDHMVRVLKDGREADIVSLEAQLNSTSLLETPDLKQVEKELTKSVPKFYVKHGTSAVNQVQLREFIGVIEPVQPASFPLQSQSAADSASSTDDDSSLKSTADAGRKKPPREFVYSKNPQSSVIAMCPISQNRLWVMYHPAPRAAVLMKLFDADGQIMATVNNAKSCSGLIAITDDTVLSWAYNTREVQLISPDEELSSHSLGIDVGYLVPCASNDKQYLRISGERTCSQIIFSKANRLTYSKTGILHEKLPMGGGSRPGYVSNKGDYIAFIIDGGVHVYTKDAKETSTTFSTYHPHKKAKDVRFCKIGGHELLLVIDQHTGVNVVDHTDGGAFLCYLDTGTLTLSGPQCLATDSDQHVWIGCKGGKVVMVSL